MIPDLPENSNVGSAHQLLAQDVHAVRDVVADNVFAVDECTLLQVSIILVIPPECFPEQILSMLSNWFWLNEGHGCLLDSVGGAVLRRSRDIHPHITG
jgi:hypothetical protein